jgi:hypothetical protein
MWAKDIILKPIDSKKANEFVKKHHYSWKVVNNSQLHFGVFINNVLGWVMSYWPSTDKSKLIWLIEWTERNEFIELNRMAFSDILPKNSESRAIAMSIKLLKKKAPHLKWIVSFADGCQCWDGTIYRASGFELTNIWVNNTIIFLWNWETTTNLSITKGWTVHNKKMYSLWYKNPKQYLDWEYPWRHKAQGYMLRYIIHLKPNLKRNYEILPYSKIQDMWAWMYKGEKKEV